MSIARSLGDNLANIVQPVRLAGGPVIIAMMVNMDNNHGIPDTGLTIAAIILLNVGVIPLIVADLGLTRIMYVYLQHPKPPNTTCKKPN